MASELSFELLASFAKIGDRFSKNFSDRKMRLNTFSHFCNAINLTDNFLRFYLQTSSSEGSSSSSYHCNCSLTRNLALTFHFAIRHQSKFGLLRLGLTDETNKKIALFVFGVFCASLGLMRLRFAPDVTFHVSNFKSRSCKIGLRIVAMW